MGLPVPLRRPGKPFSQSPCTKLAPCEVSVKTQMDVSAPRCHSRTVVSSAGSSITHGRVSVRRTPGPPGRKGGVPRPPGLGHRWGQGLPPETFPSSRLTGLPGRNPASLDERSVPRSRLPVTAAPHRCAASVPLAPGRTQLERACRRSHTPKRHRTQAEDGTRVLTSHPACLAGRPWASYLTSLGFRPRARKTGMTRGLHAQGGSEREPGA